MIGSDTENWYEYRLNDNFTPQDSENILVVRCNISVKPDHMRAVYDQIMSQKNTGVVVLPHYCDARIIPKGTKVVIEVEKENVYAQHER